jgi:hypothetical protein
MDMEIEDTKQELERNVNELQQENARLRLELQKSKAKKKERKVIISEFIAILEPKENNKKRNRNGTYKKTDAEEENENKIKKNQTSVSKTKRKYVRKKEKEKLDDNQKHTREDNVLSNPSTKSAADKLWKALESTPVNFGLIEHLIQEMKRASSSHDYLNQTRKYAYPEAKTRFYTTTPLDHAIYSEDTARLVGIFLREEVLDYMKVNFYGAEENQKKEEYVKYYALKRNLEDRRIEDELAERQRLMREKARENKSL